jgi:hypothetical protein
MARQSQRKPEANRSRKSGAAKLVTKKARTRSNNAQPSNRSASEEGSSTDPENEGEFISRQETDQRLEEQAEQAREPIEQQRANLEEQAERNRELQERLDTILGEGEAQESAADIRKEWNRRAAETRKTLLAQGLTAQRLMQELIVPLPATKAGRDWKRELLDCFRECQWDTYQTEEERLVNLQSMRALLLEKVSRDMRAWMV